MKIIKEVSLQEDIFWMEARTLWKRLNDDELETIENRLCNDYPDGIDETALNDIFRFDTDFIFEIIGIFDRNETRKEKDKKEGEFWDRPIIR